MELLRSPPGLPSNVLFPFFAENGLTSIVHFTSSFRGFKEAEMDRVVAFIDSALKLAVEIQVL